jgi:hypothetical protein
MEKPSIALVGVVVALVLCVPVGQGGTDKSLKPINLFVNTNADEDEPHLGDNGLTLYWTSKANRKEDIFFARRRTAASVWPSKGEVIEDYVTTKGDDRSVFATSGRYPHFLFFATKKDEKSKNFDLYVAIRHDTGKAWAAPVPVMNVNTPQDELHPWMTADGKALYFSRKTKEGWRVFVTTRAAATGPGGWGDPEIVDLPVNFHHATLMPDGKTMCLQGPLDKGRWGIFVSRRDGKTWSNPEALAALNHLEGKTGDRSPNLSRDGRFLYFSSDRPGGKGGLDLWAIATADLLKKK